ncbi:MAG: cytochrome c [Bacteroidetes bacterium]|nr:cytochrome c [Bacteroidota bacterium]
MKKAVIAIAGFSLTAAVLVSCGGGSSSGQTKSTARETSETLTTDDYDPNRGEGKFDESNVEAGALNMAMAEKGEAISGTKCLSCHKLSDEKLVGPGWEGVTERRSLHWIMNFITNPDPMIDKDPEVQAQLELCLVRMPNQNLADEEAREIVEFMRKNDGVK